MCHSRTSAGSESYVVTRKSSNRTTPPQPSFDASITLRPLNGALSPVVSPVQFVAAPLIRTSKVCGDTAACTRRVTVDQTLEVRVPQSCVPDGTVWATSVVDPGAR